MIHFVVSEKKILVTVHSYSRCFPLIMHLSLSCIFLIPYPVPHFQYSRHYLNPTPFKNSVLITHCICILVTHSCPTLGDPMDYGPPGSSDHGDFPLCSTIYPCRFYLIYYSLYLLIPYPYLAPPPFPHPSGNY